MISENYDVENDELEALRESIRDVLEHEWGPEATQKHCRSSDFWSNQLWRTAAELGWLGLPIAEEFGGLGMGMAAVAVLYEELGRALAPIPVLPTLLAAIAIEHGGSAEQRGAWLRRIAAGEMRGAVTSRACRAQARRNGSVVELSGRVGGVLDAAAADIIVVSILLDGDERRLVLLPEEDGSRIVPTRVADRTRTLGAIELEGLRLPASRLLEPLDEGVLSRHAAIGIACDAAAAADEMLSITTDYLKVREQFGRAIGSFQALKHRVADHKAALVVARAGIEDAAARDSGDGRALADAYAAKAHATSIATRVTQDCIQLHGGIGFTSEHIAHRYHKRALLDEAIFGSVAENLDDMMRELVA